MAYVQRTQDTLTVRVLEGLKWTSNSRGLQHGAASKLVRWLKGNYSPETQSLADQLEDCGRVTLCGSGACPYCIGCIQTWYAKQACAALKTKGGAFRRLTLIPPTQEIGLDLSAWESRFRRALRDAGITFGFGGIDVAWNEDHRDLVESRRFKPHWSVHLWFVGVADEIQAAEKQWKREKRFPKTNAVRRPLRSDPFDDMRAENLMYALKPNFWQRNTIAVPAKNGRKAHRGTRLRPLRIKHEVELAFALDSAGMMARTLMFGAQTHHGPEGSKISLRSKG